MENGEVLHHTRRATRDLERNETKESCDAGPAHLRPCRAIGEFFFNSALFCSYYKTRIRLQGFSDIGHGRDRRIRIGLIPSGKCDRLVWSLARLRMAAIASAGYE
jgi:hypothetical protein